VDRCKAPCAASDFSAGLEREISAVSGVNKNCVLRLRKISVEKNTNIVKSSLALIP
jgi:hypothetical protein